MTAFVACSSLKAGDDAPSTNADGGGGNGDAEVSAAGDAANVDDGPSTLPGDPQDGSTSVPAGDGSVGMACEPLVLDCLDSSAANVIEVPSEMTMQNAVASAKANDTIQIRGASLGAGWRVPAFVTLHGCGGAKIVGDIGFAGSGGTVEGFEVTASVVANQTGTFVIRKNRFTGTAQSAGASVRSVDALVSATVVALVEENLFSGRPLGVEADTDYDTGTHDVTVTVQNNVFSGVSNAITLSQSGLVGKVTGKISFNTFYGADTAIGLFGITTGTTPILGNLIVNGAKAVDATAPYDVQFTMLSNVATAAPEQQPFSGAFASGDPHFVDAANGDFRLASNSAAIDQVPNGTTVPAHDYSGCVRPRAYNGSAAASDIGAIEAQPGE